MNTIRAEFAEFSPLRVGAGSLVVAAHLAGLLALSLAAPMAVDMPLREAVSRAIDVVFVPTAVTPPPPPAMPTAPPRAKAPPQPQVAPVPVAVPEVESAWTEAPLQPSVIEGLPDAALPVSADAGPATGFAALSVLQGPPPPYPARAKRMGWQGEVLLRIDIDADGWPRAVSVARSSGHRELDATAQRHVLRTWRFSPPGAAVSGELPIRFTLL